MGNLSILNQEWRFIMMFNYCKHLIKSGCTKRKHSLLSKKRNSLVFWAGTLELTRDLLEVKTLEISAQAHMMLRIKFQMWREMLHLNLLRLLLRLFLDWLFSQTMSRLLSWEIL